MSAQFIDSSKLLYEINEHRLKLNIRYMQTSQYLNDLSRKHCKDIINGQIPFSLENSDIRKNKLSSCVRCCQEIILRISEDKNILEYILSEKETKKIIEGRYNLCGITMFVIGQCKYIHCIFAETF